MRTGMQTLGIRTAIMDCTIPTTRPMDRSMAMELVRGEQEDMAASATPLPPDSPSNRLCREHEGRTLKMTLVTGEGEEVMETSVIRAEAGKGTDRME